VNTEITVVLVEHLQCGHIRSTEHHLVHPFDALDHLDALLLGEDRWSLVLGDLLICVNSHNYFIAKCFGLSQGVGMSKVNHIIAVLQMFRDFVIGMNLYTPPTACHYPLQLRGRLWIEDQPEAFACKPKIVYPALGTSINTSKENVTLICRVQGSPNTVIAWDYNNQVYESRSKLVKGLQKQRVYIEMLRENEPKVQNFGHDVFVSRLTIVNARKSDEGVYTCLAENPGGKDSVHISVVVQKDLQRIPLIDTNFFAIVCLIAMGFLSMSILLSLVTCLIFKRFKQFHPSQHTYLQPTNFSAQQLEREEGISALSSGVVQGGKIVLDPLSAANGTSCSNYMLFNGNESYPENSLSKRKPDDVRLNTNSYFGYIDNQTGPTSSRNQGFFSENSGVQNNEELKQKGEKIQYDRP